MTEDDSVNGRVFSSGGIYRKAKETVKALA